MFFMPNESYEKRLDAYLAEQRRKDSSFRFWVSPISGTCLEDVAHDILMMETGGVRFRDTTSESL